jgi:uncharacterized protein with GYD domain
MASYVVFFGYTEQGIKNIKDSPARVEAAKKTFEIWEQKSRTFIRYGDGMLRYNVHCGRTR